MSTNSSRETLPVILVSAADTSSATNIISDLIDNEMVKNNEENEISYVWKITNKYYSADVLLYPLSDGEQLQIDTDRIEAHIIYLKEEECTDEHSAESRVEAAGVACEVRLALADVGAEGAEGAAGGEGEAGGALREWARRRRYEVVALREAAAPPPPPPPPPPGQPFADLYGLQRARAALHAHVWPGLRRARPAHLAPAALTPAPAPAPDQRADDSSDGGDGERDEGEDEEGAVERAELFVQALAALPGAGGAGGAGAGAGAAGRRERAEALVAAFCRALGHDLDAW